MRKAPGAKASTDAMKARALGAAMGSVVKRERVRVDRHLAALWVAVIITFIVAVL